MSRLNRDLPAWIARAQQHWLWPTRLRVLVGLMLALVIWGWFDVRNRGRIVPDDPWLHKTDFTVYTEAGAAFFDGRDPYAVSNVRGWKYLYPPLFAILVAPLHHLESTEQVFVWFGMSVMLCWGCYRELMRIAEIASPSNVRGHFGSIPTWLGTLAVTASAIPTLNCLQRGQVGVAKLYLLLLGFRLVIDRGRGWKTATGGMVLALAITLKVTPLVPVAVAILLLGLAAYWHRQEFSPLRVAQAAGGVIVGLALSMIVVPASLVGWNTNQKALGTWWQCVVVHAEDTSEDDFAGNSTTRRNQSLSNAVYRFGNWIDYYFGGGPLEDGPEQLRRGGSGLVMDHPRFEEVMFGVRATAGCLMLAVAVQMGRRGELLGLAVAFGVACAATLVVFTIARGHYYMMLLPACTFAPLWLQRHGRKRWSRFVAVAPVVLVLAHYIALDYAGRIGVLGIGTAIWYFALCGVLIWPSATAQVAVQPIVQPGSVRSVAPRSLAA